MTPITVDPTPPAGVTYVQIVLDPAAEATGTELAYIDLGDLIEHSAPMAPLNPLYASSFDTEGDIPVDLKYGNGEILDKLVVRGTSAADLEAKLGQLFRKLGKIQAEGGTYKRTTVTGTVSIYDLVREAEGGLTWDVAYLAGNAATVDLRYVRKPFWRGPEVDMGTSSETTLPALVFVEAGPAGDVPALGRLVVTDLSGNDQWQVDVGVQSRYYDNAATAALYYPATDLTPLGTSTDTGTAIRNTDLIPTYQAILKSELDATNLALTHKGSFRAKARLRRSSSNAGVVTARLEWGEGDYRRRTLNDPVVYDIDEREGVDTWADLGLVHISPDSTRWEFRILAASTATGDELDVKDVLLFPTTEGYIELSRSSLFENPSVFSARDEFDQTAGALTGKAAPVGGTWAGAGDSDDFAVETTGKTAQRTAVSDTGVGLSGRAATVPISASTVAVQVDFKSTVTSGVHGVLARWADVNNNVRAEVFPSPGSTTVRVRKRVASVLTSLYSASYSAIDPTVWQTLVLIVDTAGRFSVWLFPQGTQSSAPVALGQDVDLATGGGLASGAVGIYDERTLSSAATRNYDNFAAYVPTFDAAVFANQSLELRHDGADREDSAGTFWSPVSRKRGRYLKIPPAGQEGRSTRIIVKGYRYDPATMSEPALDDIQAQLFVTPRGLVAPEA